MDNLDDLWGFNDPALSETRFRDALSNAAFDRAETLTQLARSLGLQRRFDEAHAVLDEAEKANPTPRASVRVLLETGRAYNSAGSKDQARSLFEQAYQEAMAIGEEALAVDAAHMVAITHTATEALEWNEKAVALAKSSEDPKARRWLASLHNNLGWTYHDDLKDYERALDHFEKGLQARREQGNEETIRIARWCVARCHRSMGRYEEALQEQKDLLSTGGEGDGYGHEEIGECLLALGRAEEAKQYFKRANELLSADAWLRENEPARLERLQALAE